MEILQRNGVALASGRRLVIADVHGCFRTLRVLVEERIHLNKDDNLFFLGDYIDRGPDSSGVINYIMGLIKGGYKIFPLRGNHEQNVLDAINEYDADTLAYYVGKISKSPDLLNENRTVKAHFVDFFSSLEIYYDLDDFIIVHAGLNLSLDNPFEDKVSMLELRNTLPDLTKLNGRRIVHGHQVTPLDEIKKAVNERQRLIPLDNGCFYTKAHKIYDHTQTGNLCCVNLDTFELIVQKNIELTL
jgi:serine/threonine protein phosphatase 1